MHLTSLTPKKSLNKAYLKEKVTRTNIERFKSNLVEFLNNVNERESEEYFKNLVTKFLYDTYYSGKNQINTKGRIDLAIYENNKPVVIIEAKRPGASEMVSTNDLNKKALHELMLYYLQERVDHSNIDIKYLIITDSYQWFIFEASVFNSLFYQDKALMKEFTDWKTGRKESTDRDLFYNDIAKPFLTKLKEEIEFTWFDLKRVAETTSNKDTKDDKKLIDLFKVLSPAHLLKQPFANDSNSLDTKFYSELLHIIGLEETKEKGKKIIQRKEKPDTGSLLENAINILVAEDRLYKLPKDGADFGDAHEERLFNVALELCITWINRILFLKLLEGQLIDYHNGDKSYGFLDFKTIPHYDELNKLFFQVLARKMDDRKGEALDKFNKVPYLNSSLFEPNSLERDTIHINSLDDGLQLKIASGTVLKSETGKKRTGQLPTLQYLFEFLDAYDFASEGKEEIQEENKSIINASVLGLIFEKINGYKDGSFFTPGFITMYMCRETIRRAVVQKFNEAKGWKVEQFEQLYDKIDDTTEANRIINTLKICDPAVGSGHFLVSALNEIIAIKSELRILLDRKDDRLKEYRVVVENDELIITDEVGDLFPYKPGPNETQRVQEALFHEKETIIENCLFGVDINPNSVRICRLRLWIELLKSAYYTATSQFTELETLPNIDINIKQGNSLISRFPLDADLSKVLKSVKYSIDQYRGFVNDYKNATDKEEKRGFEKLIDQIKSDFRTEIGKNDPKVIRKNKLGGELYNLMNQAQVFEPTEKEKQAAEKKKDKLEKEINKLGTEIEEIKNSAIYKDAFEWRFEFPEVLDSEGKFVGFDVVIGNPPYIRQEEIKEQKPYLQGNYSTYTGTADLYVFFVERGFKILSQGSHFCFIMPNKWMQAGYGKPLRAFFLKNRILGIVDFGDLQVFDEATTYPSIITASKQKPFNDFNSSLIKRLQFENGFDEYVDSISNKMSVAELSDETWVISSGLDQNLLSKIKAKCSTLSDHVCGNSFRGVLTGLTEAFVIDDSTNNNLVKEDKNSIDLLRPFLLGRDVKPYSPAKTKKWLVLVPKGFTIKKNLPPTNPNHISEPSPRYGDMPYEEEWSWFAKSYPAIANHLLPFKQKAESRTDKGDFWWELRACDYYDEFEKPKIMYQKFQVKPCFIFDESGLFCNDSMWIIPSSDKVLLSILNSKMGWWLISKYCTAIQNGYQLIWKYFGQIPIPKYDEKQAKPIILIVDQILKSKKSDVNADVSTLEKEIDQFVYQLYGLTEEEIKIVEGKK